MESSLGYACLFFFIVCPLFTETIRCYKCDASDECRTILNDSPLRYVDEEMENLEIIDCEHFCWKAVSLGKIFSKTNEFNRFPTGSFFSGNVYRGCARKRCAVSHSMGTFSSSVCCQTDYCNRSHRQNFSVLNLIIVIFISCLFHFFIII